MIKISRRRRLDDSECLRVYNKILYLKENNIIKSYNVGLERFGMAGRGWTSLRLRAQKLINNGDITNEKRS